MDGLALRAGLRPCRRPAARLTEDQAALTQELYDARTKTVQQIADLFGVSRFTVYGPLNKDTTVPRQPKKRGAACRHSSRSGSRLAPRVGPAAREGCRALVEAEELKELEQFLLDRVMESIPLRACCSTWRRSSWSV
jgi:hypothetical protein